MTEFWAGTIGPLHTRLVVAEFDAEVCELTVSEPVAAPAEKQAPPR